MKRLAPCLLLTLLGCATTLTEGDRYYLAGDLVGAEAAYRDYLTAGQAEGNTEARARYRLGLIYALPDSDLHDLEKAERALGSLIELEPTSAWAQQAAFLLDTWSERDRLSRELSAQKSRAEFLLEEIARAQEVATRAGDEVEDSEASVERLTREIASLRRSIDGLQVQLEERQKELEEIKKIDLQPPP